MALHIRVDVTGRSVVALYDHFNALRDLYLNAVDRKSELEFVKISFYFLRVCWSRELLAQCVNTPFITWLFLTLGWVSHEVIGVLILGAPVRYAVGIANYMAIEVHLAMAYISTFVVIIHKV